MNVTPERAAKVINARLLKARFQALGVLVVGAVVLVISLVLLGEDRPTCGSQEMRPDEVCTSTRNNVTHRRSAEEQASSNSRTGWILLGTGVLLIGGGGAWAFGELARKRRVTPQQAAAGIDPSAAARSKSGGGPSS
ncbi:hypothetical protein [Saccharopolyspora griseoalba]|uniref:Transmembrane protein n=1 Tax=Saccharopolyspora griseoalba TaxID=1431848 RepID=A0ABW2LI21_9PSEU